MNFVSTIVLEGHRPRKLIDGLTACHDQREVRICVTPLAALLQLAIPAAGGSPPCSNEKSFRLTRQIDDWGHPAFTLDVK